MSLKNGLFSGAALAALMMAGTASAQTETAEAASTAAAGEEQIIVTGTRVARDGYLAPTPLTVLSTEDIANTSPTNNIADFVNQLPALAGSTRPSNSRLNLSSGQAGINALNLRNLGEVRTLILLDGRRSVPSTITGLVDVNTIPQALVERVEVVTGGASATYGSDAVGGVVNFILNKKFEGFNFEADTGITSREDGFNYSFGGAGGMSFAENRGHVLFSAEIAHRDGIFDVDRGWNQTGFVRIQDPTWTTTSTTPQFLIRKQVGAANSTPGGLITGNAVVAGSGLAANNLRGLYFGDNGQILQYQYGALTFPSPTGAAAPTLTQGGSWQVNDSGRRIGLDPEDDRRSFFGRLSYEVGDGVELFAEASYNRQRVRFNAGPNLATGITLQRDNAYLINAFNAAGRSLTGVGTVTLATTAADLPFRGVDNRREVQRYTIGAEGEIEAFGNAAKWDIYGQYGRADLREQLRDIMHLTRMANATDAVFSVAGNTASPIACRINVDASTTNNDAACVPLNRLGLGVANQAAIDYVLGDPYRDQTIEQKVGGGNFAFSPFETWAGDVSVAVGAEYREEKIKGFVPADFQPIINANGTTTNRWSVGNYLASRGKYDVKEAYLEAVVPLATGLEFNGAVRATDYSTAGYVTTWRAGATWQPIEDIRLRVTRSRDVRAPNLNELFQAGTANSDSVRNPGFSATNPAAGPATFGYSAVVTGNPNLDAEKADSLNIGAILSPSFLPGFTASVDYFRIEMDDVIDSLSAQDIVNRCFEGLQQYCDAITNDPIRSTPTAPYLIIRNQPFNFASKLVRGVDFETTYRTEVPGLFVEGEGSLTFRGLATRYIDNITNTGIAGVVPLNTVGVNGGQYSTPKWIYRVSASYDTSSYSVTAVGRGVSAGRYVANGVECSTGCPLSTTQFPTYDDNTVSGAFYVDLNITKKFAMFGSESSELFFNVTNLFDADPILLPETGLAANSTYSDLLGRAFRAGIRLKFR
ncbi:TonB-dependent receptor plug domain-containing protein [Sphingoaurantiacus capsulatus]|uniref:TonB-dependent receptor plug domain-containing protein n=1 Tax=Sphingoaurantiacus capsulatus TaxID=1771310 RepID=A0ABV7XB75_9SPHN